MNVVYVCAELQEGVCVSWVVQPDILASLAITAKDAAAISFAMCGVMVTAWIIGEIGRMIKNANNPFA